MFAFTADITVPILVPPLVYSVLFTNAYPSGCPYTLTVAEPLVALIKLNPEVVAICWVVMVGLYVANIQQ